MFAASHVTKACHVTGTCHIAQRRVSKAQHRGVIEAQNLVGVAQQRVSKVQRI